MRAVVLLRLATPWWRVLRSAAVIGVFVAAVLVDVDSRNDADLLPEFPGPFGWAAWLPVTGGVVIAVAAGYILLRRPTPWRASAAGLGAAGMSTAVSLTLAVLSETSAFSSAELLGLAVLAGAAVRRERPAQAVGTAAAVAAAFAGMLWLRGGLVGGSFPADVFSLIMVFGLAVTVGLYLRTRDELEHRRVAQIRREERFALARDLHDVVAHHVSGIVVQAQALRHVAERDPTTAVRSLEQIERGGAEALTAMRRVVTALREDGAPLPREPGALRAQLEQLTAAAEHPPARLAWSGEADATISAEVASAIVRITEEALTNARRHAQDATQVDVDVRVGSDHVMLHVRDDGHGGSRFRHGGGHGLVGIAERAELLGGELTAGHTDPGWSVRACLPFDRGRR